MCPVSTELKHAEIFERLIDDITWLLFGNHATQNRKTKLLKIFSKHDLTLNYREISESEEMRAGIFRYFLEFLNRHHRLR